MTGWHPRSGADGIPRASEWPGTAGMGPVAFPVAGTARDGVPPCGEAPDDALSRRG